MLNCFKFWGSATVGTKGQLVIPADAREALGIGEGDKMIVVSPPNSESIVLMKPAVLERHMKHMEATLSDMFNEVNNDEDNKKDEIDE